MADARRVGSWRVIPFRPERNATLDTLRWASRRLQIPLLLEVDVTTARRSLRSARERGERISFTAWVIGCVARAAAEHPRVHAVRRGRRRLVVFEDVDVSVLVEKPLGDDAEAGAETLPMPVVVRDAARKSAADISRELGRARDAEVAPGSSSVDGAAPGWLQSLFFRLPRVLRDLLFWRPLLRSPARIKRTMGTVVVTSVGMAAPGVLAWGIPSSIHPLAIGVGGITRRRTGGPGEEAEILGLTVVFDHAVTDGAPVGRFVARLHELLAGGAGLEASGRGESS